MINRRLALGLIAVATAIDASRIAFAKEKHHLNGKDLLGEKIKKNGKHKIHSTRKKVDVLAEVNNGKVTAVTAAGMQVKKVKSHQKLAETTPGITLASMQLAQADVYYYGYLAWAGALDTVAPSGTGLTRPTTLCSFPCRARLPPGPPALRAAVPERPVPPLER